MSGTAMTRGLRLLSWLLLASAAVLLLGRWRGLGAVKMPDGTTVMSRRYITIESVLPETSYPARRIDQFSAFSKDGLLVRSGGTLYDFGSGRPFLAKAGAPIQSFAVASGGVFVISRGRLGSVNKGAIQDGSEELENGGFTDRPVALHDSGNGESFFMVSMGAEAKPRYELSRISPPLTLAPLSGALEPVVAAAAGRGGKVFFALSDSLWSVADGKPKALLNTSERIVGLAVHGKRVYFSSPSSVYRLTMGWPVKILDGVGGPLQETPRGLMLLDWSRARLYTLKGA